MKSLIIVIMFLLLPGCTFHLKATDIETDVQPVEPGLKWSSMSYELESIDIFKEGEI